MQRRWPGGTPSHSRHVFGFRGSNDYSDCRVEFVQALRTATELAYGVRVDAPFLHLHKAEVMARLPADLLALTWSCYEPVDDKPCGTCNSCVLRNG